MKAIPWWWSIIRTWYMVIKRPPHVPTRHGQKAKRLKTYTNFFFYGMSKLLDLVPCRFIRFNTQWGDNVSKKSSHNKSLLILKLLSCKMSQMIWLSSIFEAMRQYCAKIAATLLCIVAFSTLKCHKSGGMVVAVGTAVTLKLFHSFLCFQKSSATAPAAAVLLHQQ